MGQIRVTDSCFVCNPLVLNSPERRHPRRKMVELVGEFSFFDRRVAGSSPAPISRLATRSREGERQGAQESLSREAASESSADRVETHEHSFAGHRSGLA